jgi:hypothetical protein
VRIVYADARRGSAELDVTDKEADELANKGRKVARRGVLFLPDSVHGRT